MGQVDPDDDTIWRWVLHHYRFDDARNERRNVVVAAYDNEREFNAEFERYVEQIQGEIKAGTRSSRENVSGVALKPGYREEHARGHSVRRAMEHGVDPSPLLDDGPLPSNMALLRMEPEPEASEPQKPEPQKPEPQKSERQE